MVDQLLPVIDLVDLSDGVLVVVRLERIVELFFQEIANGVVPGWAPIKRVMGGLLFA